jgi:hypothetical protein
MSTEFVQRENPVPEEVLVGRHRRTTIGRYRRDDSGKS